MEVASKIRMEMEMRFLKLCKRKAKLLVQSSTCEIKMYKQKGRDDLRSSRNKRSMRLSKV